VSSKELGVLLDEMTAAGKIFSWPQKKFWDRDPRTVLPDLILAFIAKSTVANASKIKTSLKLPLEMVQTGLNELADAGKLFIWEPRGRRPFSALLIPPRPHWRLS